MKYFFILFLLLFLVSGKTQTFPNIEFETFTDKEGLSDPFCNKIAQDKNGLIWVGTRNGIFRYDGIRFKPFSAFIKDDKKIKLGNIYNLHPTENGGLWIGSYEQLFYFNTLNETFFRMGIKGGAVYSDRNRVMLKCPENYYLLPNKVNKEKPLLKPQLTEKNDCDKYYNFIFDKKGNIWSWGENYLVEIDKRTRKIIKKYNFYNKAGKGFQKLFFDNKNRLWVSTWGNGVFVFNPQTKELERVKTVYNDEFVALGFSSWKNQGKNYIIVLGDASLILIEEETLQVKMFEDKEGRFRIYDALQDKQGNLWLATDFGLKLIKAKQSFFKVIPIDNSKTKSNKFQKAVTSIFKNQDNILIAKRWFDGLYIYDKNWKLIQYITQFEIGSDKNITENSKEILGICSRGEYIYVSGYYALYKINSKGKILKIVPKNINEFEEFYFGDIIPESDELWWIKYKNGVFKYNPKKDEFLENYNLNNGKTKDRDINSLFITKNKKILLSTSDGLYQLNRKVNKFQKITIKYFESEEINSVCEDVNQNIWAINSNGIVGFNPQSKKIIYKSSPQLNVSFGGSICVDNYNNIWFHTNEGYWCYVQKEKQFAKYNYDLGLPDNRIEWFSLAMINGHDGFIYAGAKDAIIKFNTKIINNHKSEYNVLITDIEINGKRYNSEKIKNGTEKLVLDPGIIYSNYLLLFLILTLLKVMNYIITYYPTRKIGLNQMMVQ